MAVFPEGGFGEKIEGFAAVVLEGVSQYGAHLMYERREDIPQREPYNRHS
jgi:hypothetical protein